MEIDALLVYLIENLGMTDEKLEDAREKAAFLGLL